jgi:hypothetical protein
MGSAAMCVCVCVCGEVRKCGRLERMTANRERPYRGSAFHRQLHLAGAGMTNLTGAPLDRRPGFSAFRNTSFCMYLNEFIFERNPRLYPEDICFNAGIAKVSLI